MFKKSLLLIVLGSLVLTSGLLSADEFNPFDNEEFVPLIVENYVPYIRSDQKIFELEIATKEFGHEFLTLLMKKHGIQVKLAVAHYVEGMNFKDKKHYKITYDLKEAKQKIQLVDLGLKVGDHFVIVIYALSQHEDPIALSDFYQYKIFSQDLTNIADIIARDVIISKEFDIPIPLGLNDSINWHWRESLSNLQGKPNPHKSFEGDNELTLYYLHYAGKDLWTDVQTGEYKDTGRTKKSQFPYITEEKIDAYNLSHPKQGASGSSFDKKGNVYYSSSIRWVLGWFAGKREPYYEDLYRNGDILEFSRGKSYANPHFYAGSKNSNKDPLFLFDTITDQELGYLVDPEKNNFTGEPILAPYPFNDKNLDTNDMMAWMSEDGDYVMWDTNRHRLNKEVKAPYPIESHYVNGEWQEPTILVTYRDVTIKDVIENPDQWRVMAIGDPTKTIDHKLFFFSVWLMRYNSQMEDLEFRTVLSVTESKLK